MGKALRRLLPALLFIMLWSAAAQPALAQSQTVTLPLTLDYGFLRSSLLSQFYTQPGHRALAAQKDNGCTKIELWDPKVSGRGGLLVIRTRLKVKAGVQLLGKCLDPVRWQGIMEIRQRVLIDRKAWVFRVRSQDSRLLTTQGEPAVLANAIYSLVQKSVHAYLDQFSVNLAPSRRDLAVQLPLLFKDSMRPRVEKWLASLGLGPARVGRYAVRIPMHMQVDKPAPPAQAAAHLPAPTPEQINAFSKFWESWDAFLVRQILTLSADKLSRDERDTLLTTLLETRYAFVQALQSPQSADGLVRRQFLQAWQSLSPILRKYLMKNPSPSLLNYLAFFTASDALAALDKLGPTLGISISREGLMRLAALIHQGKELPSSALDYGSGVDPRLRKLLGFGPEPNGEPETKPPKSPGPGSWLNFLFRPAWAAVPPGIDKKELLAWLPSKSDTGPYLAKVHRLLARKADQAMSGLTRKGVKPEDFHTLTKAVAWQESCFRQFKREQGSLTFMLSYNNSSVGIMQINERIWRGLYEPRRLRWEIGYNAAAGCEILGLYLRRYVLRKMNPKTPFSPALQARLVYAVYNGGPSQLDKFLRRYRSGRFFLSDKLFWQKYQWTVARNFHQADRCLLHPEDHP